MPEKDPTFWPSILDWRSARSTALLRLRLSLRWKVRTTCGLLSLVLNKYCIYIFYCTFKWIFCWISNTTKPIWAVKKRVASACILKRLFFFYVMLNTTEHPFEQLKALVIFWYQTEWNTCPSNQSKAFYCIIRRQFAPLKNDGERHIDIEYNRTLAQTVKISHFYDRRTIYHKTLAEEINRNKTKNSLLIIRWLYHKWDIENISIPTEMIPVFPDDPPLFLDASRQEVSPHFRPTLLLEVVPFHSQRYQKDPPSL